LTKRYLAEKGFPVPNGAVFSEFEAAKEYLNSSERPLVAKPVVGVNGSGVTVDIQNEEVLADAWEYAKHFNEEVILEELVEGVDIRVVVIGGKACSAYIRVPANVMGDGYQSIEMLMDEKNKQKLNNPRLCKTPIVPDIYTKKFLARQGFDYDSIPAKGQIVFFHLKANISKGGDTINVTDFIHPDLMHLAEEVVRAIGVDNFWGLDLLVERIDLPRTEQKCAIIEINSTANIESVNFPFYGQRYNAAHALIKHVFPESSEDEDYMFESKLVQLTGFLGKAFSDYVSRIARDLKINGSMRMNEEIAEITLQGRRHHILFFLEGLIDWQGENNEVVENLQIFNYDGNVNDGFSIEEEKIGLSNIFNDNLSTEFDFDSSDKKGYPNQDHPIGKGQELHDLNVQLFLTEFKHNGFTGRHLYNGLFELRNDSVIGFSSMYHSSLFCDNICDRFYPARKLFIKHGLPVPSLARYKYNKKKAIESFFVRHAKCCYVNIMHPEKTLKYLIRNEEKLSSLNDMAQKQGVNYLLLMEQLKGWHVCVAVVGDQAVGSLIIMPVAIEGNGSSSISTLIEEKNHQRSLNPWFRELPILFDKRLLNKLAQAGCLQEDILPEGTKIHVETEFIYEYGGETFTVDGYLHDDFYKKAVQAVECIPGLEFAYVEMIIPRPNCSATGQRWVLLKVDTKPKVAMFQYPWRGEPCNVAEKVVADLCLTERALWI
jgi:D-alanine-D-alanine ligase-like ATP-grasp enzyme